MKAKFIALLIIFSLIAPSGNLMAKEKRGAELIVQKKDGQELRGELIGVRKNLLLLLEDEPAIGVFVDIKDVKVVTIVNKSKFWKGAGITFLLYSIRTSIVTMTSGHTTWGIIYYSFIYAVPVAFIGGTIGMAVIPDKTIQIEGRPDTEVKEALEKLRKKARIPDYQ